MGVKSGCCSRVLQGFEDLIPGVKANTGGNFVGNKKFGRF
jgi:hypothetical protein